MIRYTSECDCHDPRDRIFALLSILPENEREVLGHFFPDYSLSLETAQLLTMAFLRQPRTFHILGSQFDHLHIHSHQARTDLLLRTAVDPEVRLARFEKFLALDFWFRVLLLKRSTGIRCEWKEEKARLGRVLVGSRVRALQRLKATSVKGEHQSPNSVAKLRAGFAVWTYIWFVRISILWDSGTYDCRGLP